MHDRIQTGSVKRGLSIPALVRRIANRNRVLISDEIYEVWKATTALMNHFDDQMETSDRPTEQLEPWIKYLAAYDRVHPASVDLPSYRAETFRQLRTAFDAASVHANARTSFAGALRQWIDLSDQIKKANSVSRVLLLRRSESECLARLLIVVVPSECNNYRFARSVISATVASQYVDSVIDFRQDVTAGSISLNNWFVPYAFAFAGAAETVRLAVRLPTLMPDLLRKAWVMYQNRDGHLNPLRVFE